MSANRRFEEICEDPECEAAIAVYVDTSVIGGCLDEEFAADSKRIFELAFSKRLILLLILSDIVVAEIEPAPHDVKRILDKLPPECTQRVGITRDVIALRDAYIRADVIGARWADDAAPVAAATVARADAIVFWNFKHIVNLQRIKAYNQVNLAEGYGILTILSPREVGHDDKEEE